MDWGFFLFVLVSLFFHLFIGLSVCLLSPT